MLRSLSPLIFVLLVTTSSVLVRAQDAPKPESAPVATPAATTPSWKEEYARSIGIAAYTYAFPYYYNAQLRWKWVAEPSEKGKNAYAAVNHFFHAKRLTTAKYRDGGSPNNDTLYSIAWVDVSREPVILSIPDMADRYYSFEFAAFNSDNFVSVGQRTNGSGPGNFAIVGPEFADELPSGVIALAKSPTPWVLVMGRTLVYNAQDVIYVRELQTQYKLTPLSYWGKNKVALPETRDVWQPPDPTDPLAVWKTINRALTENPPPKSQQGMIDLFATLKIGPGQNVAKLDPAYQSGLVRAAVDGQKILENALLDAPDCVVVNGWKYPPPALGRAGDKGEFLVRAAQQSLGGIAASDAAESVFLVARVDATGQQLTGAKKYEIIFPPGKLPPAKAFWSLTMYSSDANLVENSLDRYSITSRTIAAKTDKPEELKITIQHEPLTGAAAKNWLPAPPGNFYLILRTYNPDAEIVEQTWTPPAITVAPVTEKPKQ